MAYYPIGRHQMVRVDESEVSTVFLLIIADHIIIVLLFVPEHVFDVAMLLRFVSPLAPRSRNPNHAGETVLPHLFEHLHEQTTGIPRCARQALSSSIHSTLFRS
jgi:hypothetical protein